jgi:serine protease AprX
MGRATRSARAAAGRRAAFPAVGVAVLLAAALAAVLAAAGAGVRGRPGPHWVFFKPDAARGTGPAAISDVAGARRAALGIDPLPTDLPLPADLLAGIEAAGARIRHGSRWLRAVSVDADAATLRRLRTHPAVASIRPVGRLAVSAAANGRPFAVPAHAAGSVNDSAFYGPNWGAVRELGVPAAHLVGFTGAGVRIAILDAGFDPRHEVLSTRRIFRTRDFINGGTDVTDRPGEDLARHGTAFWSLLGGYRPGAIVGPAYDAEFVLAKIHRRPGDSTADEDRWVAAVEWADSIGVRIIASAVSFRSDFTDREPYPFSAMDGNTTITSRIADEAARRGILVVTAMGNRGPAPGTLGAPADADSVIAVGAVNALGAPAEFPGAGATARGPTADGRRKPEVSARGVGLFGATLPGVSSYATDLAGTSFATALIAGVAAQFIQAWPDIGPIGVRRALQLSGSRAGQPNDNVGWGVPDIGAAILFPEGLNPVAVSTVDLENRLTTMVPTFSWAAPLVQPRMRPVVYRVEVARDPVFQQVILSDTVTESFALQSRVPLRPATALWWRVSATGALGVRRTSAVRGPFSVPRWARLISPDPERVTFVDTPRPELSWVPLAAPAPVGPLRYDVDVLSAENGQPVQPTMRDLPGSSVVVAQPLLPNVAYRWRVIVRTAAGPADTVVSAQPFVITSETRPPATLLHQNFPNPFPRLDLGRTSTTIWFDLAERSAVELTIHDVRGRLVRRLIPAEPGCGSVTLEPGLYGRTPGGPGIDPACVVTRWDGTDAHGRVVPRGVYLLRLRAAGRDEVRRMVFAP